MWSWDITKLRGPAKWTYFYLYVLLDIFSRYAVGWMVARCESADPGMAGKLDKESRMATQVLTTRGSSASSIARTLGG